MIKIDQISEQCLINNEIKLISFFLGAGFSKYSFDIPLWNDWIKKSCEIKGGNNINNLLINSSVLKIEKITKDLECKKEKWESKSFKDLIEWLKSNCKSVNFTTTNFDKSISKIFNFEKNQEINILTKKISDFGNCFKNNSIHYLHGMINNEDKKYILDNESYFKLYNVMDQNDENRRNIDEWFKVFGIQKPMVFIFGHSLNEPHLSMNFYKLSKMVPIKWFQFSHPTYLKDNKKIFEEFNKKTKFEVIEYNILNGINEKNNCVDFCNIFLWISFLTIFKTNYRKTQIYEDEEDFNKQRIELEKNCKKNDVEKIKKYLKKIWQSIKIKKKKNT